MSFLDELQKNTNKAVTENGAVTNASTLDPLLDLFSLAGAMRGREVEAIKLFNKAFIADPQSAVRCLFYLRDIRGGQGERSVFRAILNTLPEATLAQIYEYIPEYGRWDEVPINETTAEIIKKQLATDEANMAGSKPVSLLAKWLPSENTSSEDTTKKANKLMKLLGLKPSQYRKKVVALRKYIKLLEQKMSAKEWSDIDYSKLPSQAQRKHTKAFKRHDEERYTEYLGKAKKGEAKMNTGTLFTYEIFDKVAEGDTEAADAMWANLPDYTNGTNALVLADVSGSMTGRPMSVSVSLALYFAEHNKGTFHDCFMTFSARPQVVKVRGADLSHKLAFIENMDWEMNTDLEAAFDAILRAATAGGNKGDDMPKVLYVISDMEFDQAITRPTSTIFENAQRSFQANGLQLPHVVFWNVDARQTQAPATKFDNHVTLISGLSQSTFKYVVEGKNPVDLMNEVLNSERYARIVIK